MLINLIANAYKFTNTGSIIVGVEFKESVIGNYLKFYVKDTGVGIPRSEHKRLFEMFATIEKHRLEINQHGTGIGLYISKNIVESLGGRIKVASEENVGSQFTFTITLKNEDRRWPLTENALTTTPNNVSKEFSSLVIYRKVYVLSKSFK